jgi:isocitrate/isopropylmalate dehydrogenase
MTTITVAYGDGVGPEIMEAALLVMREAGAELEIETIQIGQRIYTMGSDTGILPSAWETLNRTGVLLKGPTVAPDNENIAAVADAICKKFKLPPESLIVNECTPDMSARAYIGGSFAFFEPLMDASPELAGKNKAHPGAMILAAIMMLRHIGQDETAERIAAALAKTLEKSKNRVKTKKFAEAVVGALPKPAKRRNVANL